jgi:hypothetical protein
MVAAFEGWNDAGEAATAAVEHLQQAWGAQPFASIDCEEFHDFTSTRPLVRLMSDHRVIDWPDHTFTWADPPGSDGVVLLRAVEPQLRWRTYCDHVLEVDSASLWAAVPAYVPSTPAPLAALALLDRAQPLIGSVAEAPDLRTAARGYEQAIDELIEDDEGTVDYVRRLEEQFDAEQSEHPAANEALNPDGLVEEVERFLREQ